MKPFMKYGGIVASVILIVLGIASIYTGLNGRAEVRDTLKQEQIVGTPDMDKQIANKPVDTGADAKLFADGMRLHALEATSGQVYSQMGRYLTAGGKPTNDEKAAAINKETGKPLENGARNHLGDRDRAGHGPEHLVLRRERRHVRRRDGRRAVPDRDRVPDHGLPAALGDRRGHQAEPESDDEGRRRHRLRHPASRASGLREPFAPRLPRGVGRSTAYVVLPPTAAGVPRWQGCPTGRTLVA